MSFWRRLTPLYAPGEAQAIERLILEQRFNLTLADIICGKGESLSATEKEELDLIIQRLEKGEPVQYVLGTETFCGRLFHVEPGVLIPRPETEDLVELITSHYKEKDAPLSVLDIGTGSGCIAVSLSLQLPDAEVTAWDISPDALRVAADNAKRLNAGVKVERRDILTAETEHERWDIIVSNPPYICEKEKEQMHANVLDYEPSLALFVPDSSPLLFYDAIGKYALASLKKGGRLYFETNINYTSEISSSLLAMGFDSATIHQDRFERDRMLCAIK